MCSLSVQGQGLTEEDLLSRIPSVASSTRMEQPITEAPSSVTIISREMIDALGAQHIAEVFKLVPGFQSFYSNGMTFGVTAHGFTDRDPRRLEVRVNGRSVYMPQLNSVSWESLGVLPSDISHIEVARGSNVSAYGSNAILGAINIKTKSPVEASGGNISVSVGSQSERVINSNQQFATDEMFLSLRAAYKETEGFDGINDQSHVGHVVLSGVYTPTMATSYSFEVGTSRGSFGIGDTDHLHRITDDERDSSWLNINGDYRVDNQLWKAHLSYAKHEYDISRQVLLSEQAGIDPLEVGELFPGHVDELVELEEGARDMSVWMAELEHHWIINNHWKTVWGLGARVDRAKSDWLAGDGYVDTPVYYAFGNVEWKLSSKLALNLGLMLEDKDSLDTEASPRLALNYHFNSNHHLRVGATKAYRQPALMETDRLRAIRFSNGDLAQLIERSHPNIKPEEVDTYEIGYLGYWFDQTLSLDARVFREEIRGAIDLIDTYTGICGNLEAEPDWVIELGQRYCLPFSVDGESGVVLDDKVRVVGNTALWTVEGLEAEMSWKPSADTLLNLSYAYLNAGGQRTRKVRSFSSISQLRDGAPEHTFSALFSHKLTPEWTVSGFAQYVELIDWRNGTSVWAHSRVDMSLSREWQFNAYQAKVALVGQNIFNDTYNEYQRHNEFGRRAYISFSLSWL